MTFAGAGRAARPIARLQMVRDVIKTYSRINNLSKDEKQGIRMATSHKINLWSTRHDRAALHNAGILAKLFRRLELHFQSLGEDEDEDEDASEDAYLIVCSYVNQLRDEDASGVGQESPVEIKREEFVNVKSPLESPALTARGESASNAQNQPGTELDRLISIANRLESSGRNITPTRKLTTA